MYATEDYISPKYPTTEARFPLDIRSLDLGSLIHRWQGMIRNQYSQREFTFPGDRLIACSGLAKLYQQYLNSPNLAGLWLSTLALDLCWIAPWTARQQQTSPRSPSWTWTSIDNRIKWLPLIPHRFEPDINFQFLGAHLYFGGNPAEEFGPVDYGCVILCGAVHQGAVVEGASTF